MKEPTFPPRATRITVPMDYRIRVALDDPATGRAWVTVTDCSGVCFCDAYLRSVDELGRLLALLAL